MANIYSDLTSLFTDIASAIREKGGSAEPIEAMAFPNAIRDIRVDNGEFDTLWNEMIRRSFVDITNSSYSYISNYVFAGCTSLKSINFPICTNIGSYAFTNCTNLITVNFPVCTKIGS